MQPSAVPRRKYPDRCEQEQSCLRWFAKFGLAGEETGDDDSGSNSSHAREFWFRVGYKRDRRHVHDGGCVLSPLASRESRNVQVRDIGCPSTRGCPSPMSWEITSMGCSIAAGWFGTRRMLRGKSQRMPLRKRSSNRSTFSPCSQQYPNIKPF